jgi:hypothetical protein
LVGYKIIDREWRIVGDLGHPDAIEICPATALRDRGGDKRTVIELDADKIGA